MQLLKNTGSEQTNEVLTVDPSRSWIHSFQKPMTKLNMWPGMKSNLGPVQDLNNSIFNTFSLPLYFMWEYKFFWKIEHIDSIIIITLHFPMNHLVFGIWIIHS